MRAGALNTLTRAWPPFVAECRSVLGSELHYQAVLYHCLRVYGQVPPGQLGMNVKIWIEGVVSEYFQDPAGKKRPKYLGGYEPIPDVVIFRPEIDGDFRRRNYENTLRHMLMAIEVKVSERDQGRLIPSETVKDIVKLDALRIEARHRGSDMLPALVIVDTAPKANERMTPYTRRVTKAAAHKHGVSLFYVSPSEEYVVLPDAP